MGQTQLTKNARMLLDQFEADIAEIRQLAADLSLGDIRFNPDEAHNVFREIDRVSERLSLRIKADLEPALQRQESKAQFAKAVAETVTPTDRVAAVDYVE